MKKWTTPMAMEESFTANVDVAVTTCYKVKCNAQAANAYEKGHPQEWSFLLGTPNHTNARCTYYKNNVIQIDSNTHKITGMKGKYYNYFEAECQFTDANYQPINPGDLQVGKTVYWTHTDAQTYHHLGTLELTDPNKKSMS